MKKNHLWILPVLFFLTVSCSNIFLEQDNLNTGNSIETLRVLYTEKPGFTANVMAPLKVTDWPDFERQLVIAKNIGIDAVSIDVWWGDVEAAGDQIFDWSYYDTIFQKVTSAGLDLVPIMSFHQCGGNVGDDYTSYIPPWIWNHFTSIGISADDLKYKSETGAFNTEYISLWADDYIMAEYVEFMNAFEQQYAVYAADIDEINISGGTAGELRYPSYNSHDWGAYPNRGTFQFYGSLAIVDFRDSLLIKYGTLSGINSAWGTNLTSINEVNPPSDAESFVNAHDYQNIQYGRDLIDWYNGSLKQHGKNLIAGASQAFDNQFANIILGIKIPGVHWKIGDPDNPRIAEITTGLIQTSVDFTSSSTGHGYANIINTAADNGREVALHFTCLEMNNENFYPQYSLAQDLVFWVAQEAANQGITIKGENALSDGVMTDTGWDNINNAFDWSSYQGLTVLRMGNVTDNATGRIRYQQFVQNWATDKLSIHFKEYESASAYYLHAWNGLSGDLEMSYEGYFNNAHWWILTLQNAPANFDFCYVNSNNNWDGTTRVYASQDSEIYTVPFESYIYTYRP